MSIDLSWLFIITVLAGGLAFVDSIARVRGRGRGGSIIAIVELVAAVLMLVSIFFALPGGTLIYAGILELVLIVLLFFKGSGKGVTVVTIVALVLNSIVVLLALGWVQIPAIQ